ncbi:hypothetical protein, partial [Alsobacter metallidurans]|uniref:hypothetical protein n=1 Tax=Alsobacter metallidurans TaxID=340221 RepID=UPI001AEEB985
SISTPTKNSSLSLFGIRKDTAVRVSLSSILIVKEHENQPLRRNADEGLPRMEQVSPPQPGPEERHTVGS